MLALLGGIVVLACLFAFGMITLPGNDVREVVESSASTTRSTLEGAADAVRLIEERFASTTVPERIPPTTLEAVPFLPLVPITIGMVPVWASVASTVAARVAGLSNTELLPPDIVKLFVFEGLDAHSIWMKDMRYPIDIVWLDGDGVIVNIVEKVDPDTYPQRFASPVPALYVIETVSGFVAEHQLAVGMSVDLGALVATE